LNSLIVKRNVTMPATAKCRVVRYNTTLPANFGMPKFEDNHLI
jgi:hypothetical protein